jgi:peroxiredoxin
MAATSEMLPLGTPLPEFSLPDPAGDLHGPADTTDAAGILVAFLCNHCPYVVHVGPDLGRLAADWAAAGIAVFGINSNDPVSYPDDSADRMPAFAEKNGWTFPYLVDETQDIARAYHAACTPDFFLFDRDRTLVYRGRLDGSRPNSGAPVTGEELDAAIQAVLKDVPVPSDQKPSMGCSIKWRDG